MNEQQHEETISDALIEFGFVFLPLLILMLVTFIHPNAHGYNEVWISEEWSFAAVVLLGQGLIKAYRRKASIGVVALFLLGVILAVVVNVVVLSSVPALAVSLSQIVLFVLSFAGFLWVSSAKNVHW